MWIFPAMGAEEERQLIWEHHPLDAPAQQLCLGMALRAMVALGEQPAGYDLPLGLYFLNLTESKHFLGFFYYILENAPKAEFTGHDCIKETELYVQCPRKSTEKKLTPASTRVP